MCPAPTIENTKKSNKVKKQAEAYGININSYICAAIKSAQEIEFKNGERGLRGVINGSEVICEASSLPEKLRDCNDIKNVYFEPPQKNYSKEKKFDSINMDEIIKEIIGKKL